MKEVGSGRVTRSESVDSLVFDWGIIHVLSEPQVTGAKNHSFATVQLEVGKGHERHNHPDAEEIIYVVSGEAEQMIDDQPPIKVRAGDCIYVPQGVYHSTLNTGNETMHLIVVYAPAGAERLLREIPGAKVLPPGQFV